MIKLLGNFLNGITQYRLMLYLLICLTAVATVLSFFKVLPFNFINIIFSTVFITVVCSLTNKVFSKVFKVPTNLESVYITALILALILTPSRNSQDLILLAAVAFLSQASKYLVAIKKKHIFNPAAFGVALSALVLNYEASWWIGNRWMVFFIILGGCLILKKLQRFSMVLSFLIVYLVIILGSAVLKKNDLLLLLQNAFLDSPIFFFAFVMLTEPLTTPPGKKVQMIYGSIVGFLAAFFSPEMALLFGNIFSYIVSPKGRLLLKLKEKIQIAPDIYDFVFVPKGKLQFSAGQYMEWTLGHNNPDSRGVRRYFTLASSPTEDNLRIGVKFYPNSSSFKKSLISSESGREIIASQLSGDFTLPKNPNQKLCFLAGGIGVTPYRSIIRYLLDTKEKRDIILLYSSKRESDFVYRDIFNSIKTIYVVTERGQLIDESMIKKQIPDFKERIFYISGPHSMVDAFEKTLKEMDILSRQIKVDFFPGYV